MKFIIALVFIAGVAFGDGAGAGECWQQMLLGGCGLGKMMLLNRDGSVAWEIDEKREVSDIWLLENGNIVCSTKHGFREIKPNYKTGRGCESVWEVQAPKGSECHSCQPIGEDLYLAGYSSDAGSYMVEIDSKGKIHKRIEVEGQKSRHGSFRQVRKTKAGTYLTTQQRGGGRSREYSSDGKLLRTFPGGRFSVIRLENGNTLLACGDEHRLIEVDGDNKIVWELKQGDIKDVQFGFIAGIQLLKNGNIMLTNWGGHKGGSSGGAVLEVTRDKKLVYSTGDFVKNRVSSLVVSPYPKRGNGVIRCKKSPRPGSG